MTGVFLFFLVPRLMQVSGLAPALWNRTEGRPKGINTRANDNEQDSKILIVKEASANRDGRTARER